jgi:hypothetical protein
MHWSAWPSSYWARHHHTITPHLLATPQAVAAWLQYLGDYAEALVQAEKNKLQQG